MKRNKFFMFGYLILLFIFTNKSVFAGTGGARDGQVLILFFIGSLLLLLGILYLTPILIHWIHNIWKKIHFS